MTVVWVGKDPTSNEPSIKCKWFDDERDLYDEFPTATLKKAET